MTDNLKIDLVCGMDVSQLMDTSKASHNGQNFYFCGSGCTERFKKQPEKFLGEPFIKLENVWKIFHEGDSQTEVLRGVRIHIWEGDFVSIIGASGSGKSTLLNMIGLLDRPTSGRVLIRGRDSALLNDEERAELRSTFFGFVFQQYNLIPWLTAYENATLPLIFSHHPKDGHRAEARFKELGLQHRLDHRPSEMSGGEQQRVAFLRAIANDPRVILGDEPTGNLDSTTGNKLLDLLINLNRSDKKTLVIVTHDADIADRADEVITIKDGRIVPDHRMHSGVYTEHSHP